MDKLDKMEETSKIIKINRENQKKIKEFVDPLDFISFLRGVADNNQEFCYLNRKSHAYDWKVVDYAARNPLEFITISKRVFMQWKGRDSLPKRN